MHAAHAKGSPRHCLPAHLPKTRAAQVTARAAKSKISYTKNRVKVSRTPLYSQKKSAAGLHLHLPPPHAAAHYTYTRPKQKSYTLHFKQPMGPHCKPAEIGRGLASMRRGLQHSQEEERSTHCQSRGRQWHATSRTAHALCEPSLAAGCGEAAGWGFHKAIPRSAETRGVERARLRSSRARCGLAVPGGNGSAAPSSRAASVGGNSIARGQALGMATTTKAVEGGDRAR